MTPKTPSLSNFSQTAAEGGASPTGIARRPGQIVCGDIDMRIDRNGVWYYHGSPIGRKELVKLFATVLRRDEAGAYWLITPAEMARITVEDAPFLAVELSTIGEGSDQAISLRTNIDKIVNVDGDHPLRVEIDSETLEPNPYVTLDGNLEAKLVRPVYYELVSLGVEELFGDKQIYGVWSNGDFFAIGTL
ncbi:MAG: DUF1285 domain-containing protein [Pseudomonadota bacterium]|nr:DUF1285 domain-containing protein [Pseudomonadota bacterium]